MWFYSIWHTRHF